MPTTVETEIKTSKERLFAHLESEDGLKKWLGELETLDIESTPEGEIRKGSPFTLKLRSKAGREIRGEVVAYRKPELFGVRLFLTHAIVDLFFDLEETQNGVRLDCDCEIGVPEGTSRIKALITTWRFRRTLSARLKKLKALLENKTASA